MQADRTRFDSRPAVSLEFTHCVTCAAPLASWEVAAHEAACSAIKRDWPGVVLDARSDVVLNYLTHREKVMAARARLAAAAGTDPDELTSADDQGVPSLKPPPADPTPEPPKRWPFGGP